MRDDMLIYFIAFLSFMIGYKLAELIATEDRAFSERHFISLIHEMSDEIAAIRKRMAEEENV